MSLPELAWQIAYGRLGWAIVLAALLLALWPRARRLPGWPVLLAIGVLAALPGNAAPAYWLGLAFQYPSGLLLGLCVSSLLVRWRATATVIMPTPLAAVIAMAGVALYLDAIGLLSRGYYYAGFGPVAAPLLALLCIAGCALAIALGRGRMHNGALLGAFLLFSVLRLPTGNLWDAVLDPLLWAWALLTLARRGMHRLGRPASIQILSKNKG